MHMLKREPLRVETALPFRGRMEHVTDRCWNLAFRIR